MRSLSRLFTAIGLGLLLFMGGHGISRAADSQTTFHMVAKDYQSLGMAYGSRPTGATGRFFWCTDCVPALTCSAASGAGAWAYWTGSVYSCSSQLPTNLLTTATTFAGDVVGTSGAMVVQGWESVLLDATSFAAPLQHYTPLFEAGTGKWTAEASAPPTTGLVVSHTVYAGGNIAVNASGNATIQAVGVTMPSSGCPCRVLATWNIAGTDAASIQLGGWVNDGTNSFSGSQSNTGAAHGGVAGSGVSPVTYANNASVTFTQLARTDSGNFTIKASGAISAQIPTYMDLIVFASN